MTDGYKTLLVHFDTTPRAEVRLRLAARLAADFEAHLQVSYSVLSPMYAEPFMADGGAYLAQELLKLQERRDREVHERFEKIAASLPVKAEWLVGEGDPVSAL
ncbi:MAG: hypothetical protein ACK44L_16460, partial [Burkholderiales bacterium]